MDRQQLNKRLELQNDAQGNLAATVASDLAIDLVTYLTQRRVRVAMHFRPEPEGVLFSFPGTRRVEVENLLSEWSNRGSHIRRYRNPH
jgi:hypothetical protein